MAAFEKWRQEKQFNLKLWNKEFAIKLPISGIWKPKPKSSDLFAWPKGLDDSKENIGIAGEWEWKSCAGNGAWTHIPAA